MINTDMKREKKISNNLTLHLKQLAKGQTKPNVSRRKEVTEFRGEINEIENSTHRKDQ